MHNFRSLRDISPRWFMWVAHLFIYLLVMGFMLAGRIPVNRTLLAVIAMVWFALWVIHALVIGLTDARELAKHRKRDQGLDADEDDKPKRGYFEIGEDGELVEVQGSEQTPAASKRRNNNHA